MRIAVTFACLLCALHSLAEEGSAVFGSWQNPIYADRAKLHIADRLHVSTRIVTVDIKGSIYHRVISDPGTEEEIRTLIAQASAQGFNSWFLTSSKLTAATIAVEHDSSPPRSPSTKPLAMGSNTTAGQRPVSAITNEGTVAIPFFERIDITIDGDVNESAWLDLAGTDNMVVTEPDTGAKPTYPTVSRFIYTNEGLYVSAVMSQPRDTIVDRLSARDQNLNRDSFHITLDPSGEGLYGYWFEVSAGGTVLDGKVVPERAFSEQWDGPWQGAASVTEEGWSAEMFLPWSMMAMPQSEARKMGFWLRRKVAHLDETYSWPALPFRGPKFMTALKSMALPGVEPRRSLAIFPYASATHDEIKGEDDYEAGLDFSYRPSSNLQITGTVNPDFGAVESDNVVINLSAFETFFPEKRLFFLEGNEVFETSPRSDINRYNSRPLGTGPRATPLTYEPEPTTLLNTRRIGGAAKHVDIPTGVDVSGVEQSKPTDLLAAIKLVGQSGQLRYGVLGAFEDDVELAGTDTETGASVTVEAPGRDFGVFRALYEQTGEGRRSIGYMGTLVTLPGDDSMVHGVDGHILTSNGKWRWDGQYFYSQVRGTEGHGIFHDISYTPNRNWFFRGALDWLDDEVDVSHLGFIRRNDIITGRLGAIRRQSRGMKHLRSLRNSLFMTTQWNNDGFANRLGIYTNQTLGFNNRSEFKFTLNYFPEHWDDRNSRGHGLYKLDSRWFSQIGYGSDTAKPFSWSSAMTAEQEELGGWTYTSDLGFTYAPSGRFSLDLDLRYRKRHGWLVYRDGRNFTTYSADEMKPTMSADFFFNARHQLRMTLQWAGIKARDEDYLMVPLSEGALIQRPIPSPDGTEDFTISRLTAQIRYRWEIGPLSDLFVVYTRGSNIPSQIDSGFDDLLSDAFSEPIVDVFVVKLRYRFGL